jgi:hypothetical protein
VFACFGRTLSSYFIADDFAQVAYVAKIFHGDMNCLISNFTGNYMQIPVMKIYRPCLLLSLLFDFALWRTNAFGYFLTNVLFLIAASQMFYLLLRELTRSWTARRSIVFALLATALFASNPLHCESVSFISGRDSILSAFFYLLSLWCFIRKGTDQSWKLSTVGVFSFLLAVLSKEMAIGLPVVLSGICLFLPETLDHHLRFLGAKAAPKERFRLAAAVTTPLWLATVIYLAIRYAALGTFTGGYTGGIGADLMANCLNRWTSLDTIYAIAFPFNYDVFGIATVYRMFLSLSYGFIAATIMLKLLLRRARWQWFAFLFLWTLTTIAPLYQLWGLGQNLQGSRFFFFFSMPLSVLLPLSLLSPSLGAAVTAYPLAKSTETIEKIGAVSIAVLVLFSCIVTFKNNIPWAHAGKQTRACLLAGQRLAKSIAAGKKVALLGIPKEVGGAHVIYNGSTFAAMMAPPFSKVDYQDKFLTFDPLFFGSPQYVNAERLRQALGDPSTVGLYVWNEQALRFDLLPNTAATALGSPSAGDGLKLLDSNAKELPTPIRSYRAVPPDSLDMLFAPLCLNPFQYDFIEIEFKRGSPLSQKTISLFWKGVAAPGGVWANAAGPVYNLLTAQSKITKVRLRLSDRWEWFAGGAISAIGCNIQPWDNVEIANARLVCASKLVPRLTIKNGYPDNLGVYSFGASGLLLAFDGTAVKGCSFIEISISKPDYFFEGLSAVESTAAVAQVFLQAKPSGCATLSPKIFAKSGYYQIRARCLDAKGLQVGEYSDPASIRI